MVGSSFAERSLMADRVLPSREKWNTPHAHEYTQRHDEDGASVAQQFAEDHAVGSPHMLQVGYHIHHLLAEIWGVAFDPALEVV